MKAIYDFQKIGFKLKALFVIVILLASFSQLQAQTITATNSSPVCVSATLSLDGAGAPATGTNTWVWLGAGGTWSSSSTTAPGTTTFSVSTPFDGTVVQAGVYTLTVSNTLGGTYTATTTVVSSAATAVASPLFLCTTGEITLTGGPSPNSGYPLGYTWTQISGPGVTTYGSAIAQTTTATVSDAGTYSYQVSVVNAATSCTFTATTADIVVGTFTATATASATSIGNCQTLTLTGTPAQIGTCYTYSWVGTGGTITNANQRIATVDGFDAAGGTYSYTLTVTGDIVSIATTANVTVAPAITATATSDVTTICQTGTLQLTATPSTGGYTYSWAGTPGSTISNPAISNPTVTFAGPGTYSYTVTVSKDGCSLTKSTSDITVGASYSVTATPDVTTICQTGTLQLTATPSSGGYTYLWTGTGGTISSTTIYNPTVTYGGPGTYSYTVTVSKDGCAISSNTAAVTVGASFTATATSDVSTICQTGTLQLTATPSSGYAYLWSGTPGSTISNSAISNPTVTFTTAGTKSYTVTLSKDGCTTTANTTNVTVGASFTATATSDVSTICQTGTLQLTANPTSSYTYSWVGSAGSAISDATIYNPTVTFTTAGTKSYTVTLTKDGCSTSSTTALVTVGASFTATATSNVSTICQTGTLQLTANPTSGYTYSWVGDGGVLSSSTIYNPTVTYAGPGTYSYTVTLTKDGCSATSTTPLVTVGASFTATATVSATSICQNETLQLTGGPGSGGPGYTYAWTGTGGTLSASNIYNPTVTYAVGLAGPFSYTVTVTKDGCSYSATTVDVTVKPAPVVSASYSPVPLCAGNTLTLTALPAGQTTYSWVSTTPFVNVGPNNVITINNVSTANSGTYTVTVLAANGCSNSAGMVVTVIPAVGNPSNPAGTTALCQGASPTDYTTFASDATSYTWTVSGSGNTITTGTTTGTVTWASGFSGSATVSVYATGCGTSTTASTTVTVTPTASVASVTGTTPLCIGASATYTATSVVLGGGTAYWSSSNPSVASVITDGTVTGESAGTSIITYTITGGCGGTKTATQSITITPNASVASVTGTTPLCIGASATYTATSVDLGGGTAAWSSSDPTKATVSATGIVTGVSAGSSNITYTITGGCSGTKSATQSVTINPNVGTPTAPSGLISICKGTASGTYTTTATGSPLSYAWTLTPSSAGSIAGTGTTGTVTWNPSFSGSASIVVSATNSCSTATSTVTTVAVNPGPTVTADYSPKPLCAGNTLSLIATPDGQVQYAWTATNGFSNTGPNSIITLNNVSPANNGTYTVTVQDINGCTNSASVVIVVSETVGTPSAITGTAPTCQIVNNTTTSTFNTSATFATGYNWSLSNPAAGTISATTTTGTTLMTWANGFSGSVTVSVEATGCNGPSAVVSRPITINPLPGTSSAPSGPATLCQGATPTSYTTSATNATSYNWTVSGSGNAITTGTATGTVTWATGFFGPADITVSATNACGTSGVVTTTVTITPTVGVPSAPSGLTTICQGTASGTYTTTATNAISYTWLLTPSSAGSIAGTDKTGTVTWSPTFSGSAYISVIGIGCGTQTSSITTVTVTPTAGTPSAPSGITSRCQGSGTDTFTTSATNATSYTWSISGAGNLISGTSTTGTVTWGSTFNGTAIISVYANGCGTSATATSAVTVTPAPDVTATSNSPVCVGGILILTASSTAPNTNYAWVGPSSFIYSGPNTEITFSPMASANAGTYTLTVTAPGYCSVIKTVVVALAPATVAGTVTSTQTICYNTTPANLTLNGSVGSVLYWQKSADAAFTSPVQINVQSTTLLGTEIGPLTSSYYFRAVVQSGTCAALNSTSVLITVDPFVAAPTVTLTQPTCTLATGTITITAPTGTGMTYSIGGTYTATTVFSGLSAGSYNVTAKSAAGCISAATAVTINAQPATPAAPSVTLTQPTCSLATGSILVTAPTGTGMTYSIGSTYTVTALFSGLVPGTYTVTAKNADGCISSGTVVTINAQPATPATPTVTLTQPTCALGTGTITVTAPTGATLLYSIGGTYTATTVFSGLAPGTYTVTAKYTTSDCISVGLSVTINAQPVTPAAPVVTVENLCGNSVLTAAGVTGATYLWSTGATTASITVTLAGTYTVTQKLGDCTSAAGSGVAAPKTIPAAPVISKVNYCGSTVLTASAYTGTLLWSTGASTASITVFENNTYSVTQTLLGCTSPATSTVVTIDNCGTIAGYVQYDNTYLTGMNGVTVTLKNPSGSTIGTTVTTFDGVGTAGYYLFTGITPGTYSITAGYSGAWLGNNATDALIVNLNTIGSWPLTGLRAVVADVNADGLITGLDALMIKDRVVGYTSTYPAGNWKFTSATVTLGTTATANLLALCTGDVNGSDVPGSGKSASLIAAVDGEVMTVSVNQTFTYEIKSNVLADLGAMTLFMNYDPTRFSIDKVNSSLVGLRYRIADGFIAIAWSNTKPLNVKMDETILSLNMTAKDIMPEPEQIFAITEGSEFADPLANRIDGFDLVMSKVKTASNVLEFSMVNYPNPFKNVTEIVYTIPVDGKVKLVLTNMFGQQIRTLVNEQQGAGIYKVKVNSADGYLEPGLYLYSIDVEGINSTFKKTNKMLFTR